MTRTIVLTTWLATALPSCLRAECEEPDYTQPECRVVVENELARLRTAGGQEVRFQAPGTNDADTWDARGLLTQEDGLVRARVAGPGDFAISVRPLDAENPGELNLRLDNVSPGVNVRRESLAGTTDLGSAVGTQFQAAVGFAPGEEEVWLRGELACPERYRVAILADIQTNPFQFERVVERLQEEAATSAELGAPLMALVVLGDLTELSSDEEFHAVEKLFERVPVPVAVTPGNHDVFSGSRAIFNRTFGPGNHTFRICNSKFVLLDTGNGALAPSVEGRLHELLQSTATEHLFVGTHYPAYPGLTGNGWSREDQAQHLLLEAASEQADLLLAGHVHALLDFPKIDVAGETLREIIVGTAGAHQGASLARYGYLRLTIDDGVTPCFVEVPAPGTGGTNPPLGSLPNCG